jgi:hypothetical protein
VIIMTKKNSSLIVASKKDLISFLDEIQITLGLSQQKMDTLILLLVQSQDAHLHFRKGNMDITFSSDNFSEDPEDSEFSFEVCTGQVNYTSTISYKIPQSYLHSIKKKSSFVKLS